MSQPTWPSTGGAPAIGTLGDLLARKNDTDALRLLEGFSGYLLAFGSDEESTLFNAYFFGTELDSAPSEALVNAVEEKFQTFSWGADLDGSAATVGDPRSQAKPTFAGGIEISRQVRYWSDDLTRYDEGGVDKDANGEKPQLGFDRALGADGNLGTIIGIDDAGRPVVAEDTETTTIGFKAEYTAASAHVSDLISQFPKLKNAVAYTAVGRKRAKEFRTDAVVRKQLKHALQMTRTSLIGEKYSMKGASSLVAKAIEDTMKVTDDVAGALIAAVDATSDGVRYTVDLPKESYAAGVTEFLSFLKSQRWANTQFKNFWANPSPTGYRGINTKWSVTIGTEAESESVEVQFHTKESYDAKEEKTHELKEQIRVLTNKRSEAEKKRDAMAVESEASPEYVEVTAEIERLTSAIKDKDVAQRAVFEEMALAHTPEGAASITLG